MRYIFNGVKLTIIVFFIYLYTTDCLSKAQLDQIGFYMDIYLQRECRYVVERDQEIFKLQQELKEQSQKPEELHEDMGASSVLKVEQELKLVNVKEEYYLEQQSFDQQLAAEVERTHRAERERQVARQEVEQAREEAKRIENALETEQQMRQAISRELEVVTEERRRMRDYASEQEKLRLESQSQRQMLEEDIQGLRRGLQYLRSKNEELESELTNNRNQLEEATRSYAAEQERARLENWNLQQRFETENQALQWRLNAALTDLERYSQQSAPHPVDIGPWNVSRGDVQVSEEIGRGGWGTVVRGIYCGKHVAVKLPHQDLLNPRLLVRLKRETRLMIQVQHPNLIRIIAAVFDEASDQLRLPPMIITELLDINLRKCYQQGRLQVSSRIPVCLDVAYGLHYLHDRQEPIIHRDVSAPNVLLKALPNGMWRAKVSDFGSANLARFSVTAGDGAIIYTPPEAFPQTDPNAPRILHTTKIDVFSYGIVMCEVITAEQPDPELYLDRLEQVRRWSAPLHSLIVLCTNQSPEKRPTMAVVIDELNKVLQP